MRRVLRRRRELALHDTSVPLPPGAAEALRDDHPRLAELRAAYAGHPAAAGSRWTPERVAAFLDLRYFRGETLITWHYREGRRATERRYRAYADHVAARDPHDRLATLGEDGAFGCWTYAFPGQPRVSRDLLDSVLELAFIERALGRPRRVLDIGAGYGRLAHRMTRAWEMDEYACLDAVPESTFVCEYYLRHRGVAPPARVVALPDAESLGGFDLALNVHSFSEMPSASVAWWLGLLREREVPRLLVVPNDGAELLSLEPDGTRRDLTPLVDAHGYALEAREPVIDDPHVRELVGVADELCLYARR